MLRESDYVTLHLRLSASSRNLIDEVALACMKQNAILVNTARGGLVDERALLKAVREGRIVGAGLDVLLGERDLNARKVAEELMALPNVITTPHVAGASREGSARANLIAAKEIVAVLDGGSPPGALGRGGWQVRKVIRQKAMLMHCNRTNRFSLPDQLQSELNLP